MQVTECPLWCGWRQPNGAYRDLAAMRARTLEHVAAEHLEELQLLLAGAEGGRGEPQMCVVTQHLDARQVNEAADLVLSVLVPKMRGQLARELTLRQLRPLDPWPAVTVHRYRWAETYLELHPDAPGGLRPAREDETPELYQLELRTLAVQDTRPAPQL